MAPSSPAVAEARAVKAPPVAAFQLAVIAAGFVGVGTVLVGAGTVLVGLGCVSGPVSVGAVHAGSATIIENAKRQSRSEFMGTALSKGGAIQEISVEDGIESAASDVAAGELPALEHLVTIQEPTLEETAAPQRAHSTV
jgi:hypothetical protein